MSALFLTFCRYFQTIRYLKGKQIGWRIYYIFRKKVCPSFGKQFLGKEYQLQVSSRGMLQPFIPCAPSFSPPLSFRFLNRVQPFDQHVDWNFSLYGKLWTYNLNYFDFLLQEDLDKDTGIRLIHQYINSISNTRDGLEPYPTSLRLINWIKYLLKYNIEDTRVTQSINGQLKLLNAHLEYHLLGNHILENAFGICTAALFVHDEKLLIKGKRLLVKELHEQILNDGGHFELSPMYHQVLLGRLLDLVNIADCLQPDWELKEFCKEKAGIMLGWLHAVSSRDGSIPLLNDAAYSIAPTTSHLNNYAEHLGILPLCAPLQSSGYRKFQTPDYEFLFDIGPLGPDYQLGHAHADTFHFVLHAFNQPIIVDTGLSTYEPGPVRNHERSTAAHNTVCINNKNSSDVWGKHRVGTRARVNISADEPNHVIASHTGYTSCNVNAFRTFSQSLKGVVITDELKAFSKRNKTTTPLNQAIARLHLHPGIKPVLQGNTLILTDQISVTCEGNKDIRLETYQYAPEFNLRIEATVCEIPFTEKLTTNIIFHAHPVPH